MWDYNFFLPDKSIYLLSMADTTQGHLSMTDTTQAML